jgi:hypothetical protein
MESRAATTVLVIVCAFLSLVSSVWAVVDASPGSDEGSPDRRLKKDARALLGLLAGAAATGLAAALINAAA